MLDFGSDHCWCLFVKKKSDMPQRMLRFLHEVRGKGFNVKFIRCDNAGENKALQKLCEEAEMGITFECTPSNSPQFNGRMERKIATLWGVVRSILNGGKFDAHR